MTNLSDFRVHSLPPSAYYIPDFITDYEEEKIIDAVYSAPKPKWKVLSNRRLQNWGGLPHVKGMIKENLPVWLIESVNKVKNLEIFGQKVPNHVLVNEYLTGQGIMPHEDGPIFYPTIATISLGSHTILDYYKKSTSNEEIVDVTKQYIGSLFLERRSLLVVQDDLYDKYLHGIQEKKLDVLNDNVKNLDRVTSDVDLMRKTRLSLTIRHVPHTVNANCIFGRK